MNVFIRADASETIGSGHIMRCLTLAQKLKEKGANVLFISRQQPGDCCNLIESLGYSVIRLDQVYLNDAFVSEIDKEQTCQAIKESKFGLADWLIVDHYLFSHEWESALNGTTKKIFVIDDLANRKHECHALLDVTLCDNYETRYDKLVPESCKKFLGPKFALLRPEFYKEREKVVKRSGEIKRVVISFGGGENSKIFEKILPFIEKPEYSNICFDIITGRNLRIKSLYERLSQLPNVSVYERTENMAKIMASADLAIGAAGSTSWERCFCGLPTLFVILAKNQEKIAEGLEKAGAGWIVGEAKDLDSKKLEEHFIKLLKKPTMVAKASEAAMNIIPHGEKPGVDIISEYLLTN